jgi:hypothetical protein
MRDHEVKGGENQNASLAGEAFHLCFVYSRVNW